jgi:ABC-type Zn uptake system ZnuABC Zn-binding protein ZnuA
VELVSRRLQALRPQSAGLIQARAEAMQASLAALDRWNQAQFATIPAPRILATGHRAFASLARAYGLSELAVLDAGSASTSLRPQALAAVVDQLRQGHVRALFSERLPAARSLSRISALSGVPIAREPLPADHGGDDLMATLTANTCLVVEHLGGQCDRGGQRALIRQWQEVEPQASQQRNRLL